MRTRLKYAFMLVLAMASASAHAEWRYFPQAKILGVAQWQDESPFYFKVTEGGTYCYVPASEKNMIALILSLYSSGRPADIHCHETPDTVGGMPGHRLHRIISS